MLVAEAVQILLDKYCCNEITNFKFGELRKSKFVMVDNMEWFNVFGLIFIAVIMIPNVVFAIKCKDGFDNKWRITITYVN